MTSPLMKQSGGDKLSQPVRPATRQSDCVGSDASGELEVSADCEHHTCFAVPAVLSPDLDKTTHMSEPRNGPPPSPAFGRRDCKTDRHRLLRFDAETLSGRWVVTTSVSSAVMPPARRARASSSLVAWGGLRRAGARRASRCGVVVVPATNELSPMGHSPVRLGRRGAGSGTDETLFADAVPSRRAVRGRGVTDRPIKGG